ncbi:hypothetical protein MKX01_016526, partial [Papaver californicum]
MTSPILQQTSLGATSETPISESQHMAIVQSQSAVPAAATASTDSTEGTLVNKRKRPDSWVWEHFTKVTVNNQQRAICKHCKISYSADSKKIGTSTLNTHLLSRCKRYPGRDDKQKSIGFEAKKGSEEAGKMVARSYSDEL